MTKNKTDWTDLGKRVAQKSLDFTVDVLKTLADELGKVAGEIESRRATLSGTEESTPPPATPPKAEPAPDAKRDGLS